MTVGELIAALSEFNPELMVVIQEDAEGNDYSPLNGSDIAYYVAHSTWSGEAYSQEDVDNGDAESGGQDVVILWPVN